MADYNPYEDDEETPEDVDEEERKANLLESVDKSDLNWVLSDIRGRRFLCRLVNDEQLLESSFVAGSPDMTAYNEGVKDSAVQLFKEIREISVDMYARMMVEAEKFRIKPKRKGKKNASGRKAE